MIRSIKITKNFQLYPAGSVLIEMGNTKVICAVTIQKGVPSFLKEEEQGWMTAEYGMLPSSPNSRFRRESIRGKIVGRTAEIQRLIGRALRAVFDMTKIPGYTVLVDCDVIQADGGTRTASITGACVALQIAMEKMLSEKLISENPLKELVAAISVGIVKGEVMLDLDYENDSQAETDMNVVMTESGKFIEIQGTAEKKPFDETQLQAMLQLAKKGIQQLLIEQKKVIEK
jgi:ribonuclease PH